MRCPGPGGGGFRGMLYSIAHWYLLRYRHNVEGNVLTDECDVQVPGGGGSGVCYTVLNTGTYLCIDTMKRVMY